jgi:hypothetical protein
MAWLAVAVGVISVVLCSVGGLVQAVQGDLEALWVGFALAALFGLTFGVTGWRFGLRPRIMAEVDGVSVRNPGAETFVPWVRVVHASAGYSGITIRTSDGEVTAWAVQKSNLARWLHRGTRADDVADFINRHGEHREKKPPNWT